MHASIIETERLDRARELIELALDQHPSCRQCGEPTTVTERDGGLWLECASLEQPRHPLLRLVTADFAFVHERRLLADLVDLAAA